MKLFTEAERRNVELIRWCRSQPSPVRHVSNAKCLLFWRQWTSLSQ